jgi:hypothetical protein
VFLKNLQTTYIGTNWSLSFKRQAPAFAIQLS